MAISFGVTNVSGSLIERSELEHDSDVKVLLDSQGQFSAARTVDDSYKFTVSGFGDLSLAVGGNSGAPTGATGLVIITSTKITTTNEKFQGWEITGMAYPHAT